MNLLTRPVITTSNGPKQSLPAMMNDMARGSIRSFPRLRPHQRPAWHMFLVQLAALAITRSGRDEVPEDESGWRSALRELTPGYASDEPWRLVAASRDVPAFMQPPDPGGLKWSTKSTPDALDMLITARNHDLKQSVAAQAEPEDWAFALVSLQTCEGYGGRGNQGIARMNGGSSSRPMLGLVPANDRDHCVHASRHWLRDLHVLLANRMRGDTDVLGTPGGHALLWLTTWPERSRLELNALDPWFIEVCRRVRLVSDKGGLIAECANAEVPRTNAKAFHGNVGDPWTPIERKGGKSLTISHRGFDYKRICDLLYSGNWEIPVLARPTSQDAGDMLLLAEAISRGNSKTEGFKSRTIPVPSSRLRMFTSAEVGQLAEAQTKEIEAFDIALRDGLALVAAGGDRDAIKRGHYGYTNPPRARFDRAADAIFFPRLWARAEAAIKPREPDQVQHAFLAELKKEADRVFAESLPQMPCRAIHRKRAEARGRRRYEGVLRSKDASRALFNELEEVDVQR